MTENNQEILNYYIIIQELFFRLNKYIELLNILTKVPNDSNIKGFCENHPYSILRYPDWILEDLEQKIKSFQELKNEIESKELISI